MTHPLFPKDSQLGTDVHTGIAEAVQNILVSKRMTTQIAEALELTLRPRGVAVVVEARHMCSMMRGVKKVGATLLTQSMLGAFKDDIGARQEFLSHIKRRNSDHILHNPAFSSEE